MPPYLPSGPVPDPVTQVFTTRLVLDSSTYGCPEEKALWRAFNKVVVETCDVACCIVFVRPGAADEALEYEDMRYAMVGDSDARYALEGLVGEV